MAIYRTEFCRLDKTCFETELNEIGEVITPSGLAMLEQCPNCDEVSLSFPL